MEQLDSSTFGQCLKLDFAVKKPGRGAIDQCPNTCADQAKNEDVQFLTAPRWPIVGVYAQVNAKEQSPNATNSHPKQEMHHRRCLRTQRGVRNGREQHPTGSRPRKMSARYYTHLLCRLDRDCPLDGPAQPRRASYARHSTFVIANRDVRHRLLEILQPGVLLEDTLNHSL